MSIYRKVIRIFFALLLVGNIAILPVSASEVSSAYVVEPRYVNITGLDITIYVDANSEAYCTVSIVPKDTCRGFDGALRLTDSDGTLVKSWAISDFTDPFMVEKSWQCESGKTYTFSFQGYAYHNNGGMYDDLVDSKTFTCP